MKIKVLLACLLLNSAAIYAQQNIVSKIAAINPPKTALAPLLYLASDELKGRGYDRPEINIAAKYIAGQFKSFGAKIVPGATGYFQPFKLKVLTPATTGQVAIGATVFKVGDDVLQQHAGDVNLSAPLVYAGHITPGELDKMDAKGKIVLMDMGNGDEQSAMADFMRAPSVLEQLDKKGAAGLVERFNGDAGLWLRIKNHLTQTRPEDPAQTSNLPAIILNNTAAVKSLLTEGFTSNCTISISGTGIKTVDLKNVMCFVEGTDPRLRGQYILLSSHYDHLGVAKEPKMEEGKLDSIYNGARDNATGTTAVIDAARYFAKYPPKRSVLFITYTAEEEGLVGSAYYALHPLVPLNKTVYNLNIDNASYNDTTLVTLVGLGRTSEDSLIIKAVKTYGMHVNNDPTGGQLFFGSDNFPLAGKGVPAPTYSLGMKTFDSEIRKRYHRLSDETGNMNMSYVIKFIRAYILAARYIANDPAQPRWTKGDELEPKWQQLFGTGTVK